MQAIIFSGIQATGKSSFYKKNFFNSHVRISMDLLNTRNKENRFIQTCFDTHTQFVVDNTNPTKAERKNYIDKAKASNYKVIGYYFSSKIDEALTRNASRLGKEKIPEVGIRGCYSKLEIPSIDEGFDELYFVEIANNAFKITPWKNEI